MLLDLEAEKLPCFTDTERTDLLETYNRQYRPDKRSLGEKKLRVSPGMSKVIVFEGGIMKSAEGIAVPRVLLNTQDTSIIFDLVNYGLKIEERVIWPDGSTESGRLDKAVANLPFGTYDVTEFTEEQSCCNWIIVLKMKGRLTQDMPQIVWDPNAPSLNEDRAEYARRSLEMLVIKSMEGMQVWLSINTYGLPDAFSADNILYALATRNLKPSAEAFITRKNTIANDVPFHGISESDSERYIMRQVKRICITTPRGPEFEQTLDGVAHMIHVAGHEQKTSTGAAYNELEVSVVHGLVSALRILNVAPSRIAIYTPFDHQRLRIQGNLSAANMQAIQVHSFGSGREVDADIVIISLVRSGGQYTAGAFANTINIVNKLTAQAGATFFLIGNKNTVDKSQAWPNFIASLAAIAPAGTFFKDFKPNSRFLIRPIAPIGDLIDLQ